MFKPRYLEAIIIKDLQEKMVFIGGPRQVGKTTLTKNIGADLYHHRVYLNWDSPNHRKMITGSVFPAEADLVIFDEIHKYRPWKNYIKGFFDTRKDQLPIIVTGSARLDLYRRGGDSLQGRYHYLRLHPFSVGELLSNSWQVEPFHELTFVPESKQLEEIYHDLFTFGGFPEPFIKKNQQFLRRFHNERVERLINEDIRDVERIQDLSMLLVLADLLPSKVGSLLSVQSFQEDLLVTNKTVSKWIETLERFYYHFSIRPFSAKTIRSLRKMPKIYMWDWSQVESDSKRFENLIASHLLKTVNLLYDYFGYKAELYFLRDREGHEVDFLVTVNKKPWFMVEAKQSDVNISQQMLFFKEKLNVPFVYQVVDKPGVDFVQNTVRVISAGKFLSGLA